MEIVTIPDGIRKEYKEAHKARAMEDAAMAEIERWNRDYARQEARMRRRYRLVALVVMAASTALTVWAAMHFVGI